MYLQAVRLLLPNARDRSDVIAMTRYEEEAISKRHLEIDLTQVSYSGMEVDFPSFNLQYSFLS